MTAVGVGAALRFVPIFQPVPFVPATVPDQALKFGQHTRATEGRYPVVTTGGLVISTCVLSGTDSGRFEYHAGTTSIRKKTADTTDLPAGPIVLTVAVNTIYVATYTITVVPDAYSVADHLELVGVYGVAPLVFGDRILCRPGDYNYALSALNTRFGRGSAITGSFGTYEDAARNPTGNYVVVEPHEPNDIVNFWYVTFYNYGQNSLYVKFKNIKGRLRKEATFTSGYVFQGIQAVGYVMWEDCHFYGDTPSVNRDLADYGSFISVRIAGGNGHNRVKNCLFEYAKNGIWFGGENCRVQDSIIQKVTADCYNSYHPHNGSVLEWVDFQSYLDDYGEFSITGIDRNASYTRIYGDPAKIAQIGSGDWIVVTGLSAATGCEQLDGRFQNTVGAGGTQFTKAGDNSYIQFPLDSSGYAAWTSGGTVRWAGAHQDGWQPSSGAATGEYDDVLLRQCRWHGLPWEDAYGGRGVNSPWYLSSSGAHLRRRWIMKGCIGMQGSQNLGFLGNHQDSVVKWCAFLRVLATVPNNPNYAANISGDGSTGSVFQYNVLTAPGTSLTNWDKGTPDTNVYLTDSDATAYGLAFLNPKYGEDPTFDLATDYVLKPGGTLTAASTGNAYDAGPWSYVDWTTKTTSYPDEVVAPAGMGQTFVGDFDGSYAGGFNG